MVGNLVVLSTLFRHCRSRTLQADLVIVEKTCCCRCYFSRPIPYSILSLMMISWPETVSEDIASFKHSRSLMHAPEAPEDRCSLPVRHYIYIYRAVETVAKTQKQIQECLVHIWHRFIDGIKFSCRRLNLASIGKNMSHWETASALLRCTVGCKWPSRHIYDSPRLTEWGSWTA